MSSTLFFVGLKEDSKSSIARSEVEVLCVDELSQDPTAPAPERCVEEISKEPSAPAPVRCTEQINQEPSAPAPVRCMEELSKESCASPAVTPAADSSTQASPVPKEPTRVPNAPKSCIAEIFSSDTPDRSPVKNGNGVSPRPRVVRDTPTRPRDTHTRLFGQAVSSPVAPMVTDTIRSHIQFGDTDSSASSPKLSNGHSATPSRGEPEPADHSSYGPPKRNPVTGDGVPVPPQRRRHPASWQRGADSDPDPDPRSPRPDLPQLAHRYITLDWPPKPAQCYVHSTTKPTLNIPKTPYTLLGLKSDDLEKTHPLIDPNSLSPQLVLDRHWPPFPAQHYLEPKENKIVTHPLPPYAFVGMTSALGERPQPDYKYNPVPSLDGPIDPYLIANCDPPQTLFKYERDAPIPDVTPLQTSVAPGPHTLTGFPPIFPKHVPGYLFNIDRHAEDLEPKTYYVDYLRRREMEGNPITGDYKSMNGQINTVTSISTSSHSGHSRVPPGGYSSGLW